MDSVRLTKGADRTIKAKAWELNAFDITNQSMQDVIDQSLSKLMREAAVKVKEGLAVIMIALPDTRRKKPAEGSQTADTPPATEEGDEQA